MPRSPSRDLADRFEGNRGYFHRPAPLARATTVATVVALVLTLAWVVADVVLPAHATPAHTHGPVADPHAHWEDDCAACHRPHGPREFGLRSVFQARDRWHDLTCEKCHAGPVHVAALAPADREAEARCSTCHHEHGGRRNSLVRITDEHCTRCHADLAPHHATGEPVRAARVTDFVRDHPEFRPLQSPPGRTLKFSHALHLTPGQVSAPGGRGAMTLARLRGFAGADALERYRATGQTDDDLVSLNCASCHQLDAGAGTASFEATRAAVAAGGEPGRAVLPARPAGAHFLPVNFEVHCRACHPLLAPAGSSGGRVIPGFRMLHRRQPGELREELRAGYLKRLLAEDHPALATPVRPGGALDPPHAAGARTLRAETDRLATDAGRVLLTGSAGCAQCHNVVNGEVARVPDRSVWFPAARFDHARHNSVSCATCHPGTSGAFAAAGTALVEKEPVQILGVDSCRACHSPSGTTVTLPDGSTVAGGGARHSCVDCHRYHNADHGLQGPGARVLRPQRPLDLAEFLRGGK